MRVHADGAMNARPATTMLAHVRAYIGDAALNVLQYRGAARVCTSTTGGHRATTCAWTSALAHRATPRRRARRPHAARARERVALLMHNAPAYLEVMHAAWIAGLAVVPINAKLHPREVAHIVEDSGAGRAVRLARPCRALGGALDGDRHDAAAWSTSTAASTLRCSTGRPLDVADVAPDALAWLFYTSGTTGRPKGVMLAASQPRRDDALLFRRRRHRRRRPTPCCTARRCRTARGSTCCRNMRAGARHVMPASHGFDAGGIPGARDKRTAARRRSPRRRWSSGSSIAAAATGDGDGAAHDRVRRRPDVPRRPRACARRARQSLRADLRAGREPDDDHGAVARASRRPRASAPRGTARLGRRAAQRGRGARRRSRRASSCRPARSGEVVVRGAPVMAGYWRNAGRDRRRAARRLAVDRRHRRARRRRLPDAARPLEGRDHQRRGEHLSARGRGGAAAPSRRARGVRGRPAASRNGARKSSRSSCARPGATLDEAALDARVPRAHRALQAAAGTIDSWPRCRRTTTARC